MNFASFALLLVLSAVASQGQGPAPSPQAEIEPQKRAAFDVKDFQYSFNQSLTSSQFGSIQTMFANDVPSLDTLPGDGLAQAVIKLNPCAIWNPHTHPRANEILYVAQGNVKMGFQEENKGQYGDGSNYGGRPFNFTNVQQGSSVIVPQGLAHYIWNPTCAQALIVSSFDNRDPGVSSLAQTLFSMPNEVISAATGLDVLQLAVVQKVLVGQTLVSFDSTCLNTCKLPTPSPGAVQSAEAPASSSASTTSANATATSG